MGRVVVEGRLKREGPCVYAERVHFVMQQKQRQQGKSTGLLEHEGLNSSTFGGRNWHYLCFQGEFSRDGTPGGCPEQLFSHTNVPQSHLWGKSDVAGSTVGPEAPHFAEAPG